MSEPRESRYPGAAPFRDDPLAHKVFFGREGEIVALTDQIAANRLVVVYAKSGVGKTSLLNAGVLPRLRKEGFAPLMVRVRPVGSPSQAAGPRELIATAVEEEARRQGFEHIAPPGLPLAEHFRSLELWQDDHLLTPVLILDQFEEVFTLQTPEFREQLATELGALLRGGSGSAAHVVLSLREDFLGGLDELSDRLPQILTHRFRLTALSLDGARRALTAPPHVADPHFRCAPFSVPDGDADTILAHLSRRTGSGRRPARSATVVEPFQLQLVCQRIEAIALARHHGGAGDVAVTLGDLGGTSGLDALLNGFYRDVLGSFPRRQRAGVRRLCERFLVGSDGRRLSMEESEIGRLCGVDSRQLAILVDRRLLRSDQRADATFYELSHDTLVDPVLEQGRTWAVASGNLQRVLGFLFAGVGVCGLGLAPLSLLIDGTATSPGWELPVLVVGIAMAFVYVPLFLAGRAMLRGGRERLLRFRRRA